MYQRTNIRRGMAVMSRDGVQMGRIIDVASDSLLIEKGQFFLKDFRVPLSDISRVRGDEITLLRDYADLRRADSDVEEREGTAKGTVGVAGYAAHEMPHEPPLVERRAAGPGWDPLSVDEEVEKEAHRTSSPDTPKPPTRY